MTSSETPTRVCLFGKPALYVAGTIRPFGGPRKAIALLAYLMQHSGRSVSRAAVSELFWPDEDDESARAALRRHLYRALAALPKAHPREPWVIADKVRMRWNANAPLFIDTQAYARLTSEDALEAAVDLYRGDYLEDFHDDWVLPERERLRSLQTANLLQLVERRRRDLDYPTAIAYAQSVLRLDSLREDAMRRIMSLRFAAGDRSGALADFEAFRRRLHDELATNPMPETIALYEMIRNNDDASAAAEPVRGEMHMDRPAYPFVGRQTALASMRRAWESAARGPAAVAIVTGEAGVGKTRLIGEAIALAESQGGRVMVGTTRPIESEPYEAISEALRAALPLIQLDRLEPMQVAALSSFIHGVRGLAPDTPDLIKLEPESDRQRLFDAVSSAFRLIAKKRPLLVVLEDLHWAGSATVAMLDVLLRNAGNATMLVIVSFREEEVVGTHPLRALLRRVDSIDARHVALGPLQADEVRALVAGTASGPSHLADDIFAASEGNALFVTELLRARLAGAENELPRGIATTVEARLDRLTPAARSLAEAAAVTGVGFDIEVVRQATGWSFAEVFDAIDELLDRALVRESMQRRGDFGFSHQLVQTAVYATIDERARRGLHRRIGRTIQTLFADRPSFHATIARHYDAAGLTDDAISTYLASARYALTLFAHDDVIALASRALDLGATERVRFELLCLREEAATSSGNTSLRRLDSAEMSDIAVRLDDDDLLGVALTRTFAVSLQLADNENAVRAIDAMRGLGERAKTPRWAVEAALTQARFEVHSSHHQGAERVLHEAEAHAAALDDDALAVRYWAYRGFNALFTDPVRARTYVACAEKHVGENQLLALSVLRITANIFESEGDGQSLRTKANEMLRRYRDIGDIEGQATAHRNLAAAGWYLFDVAAQHEHADRAMEIYERIDKPNAVAAMYMQRGNSALLFGDFENAETYFKRALAIAQTISMTSNACSATRSLANLAWFRGDHALSRDLALSALRVAREHGVERQITAALSQLGAAERDLGLLAEALEHLETALQWCRGRDPRQVLEVLIDLIPVYQRFGDSDRARFAAIEILEGVERESTAVGFPAQALSAAASAFETAGERDRAIALMAKARLLLYEFADRIDDEPSRQGYLNLRVHRAIFDDTAVLPESEMHRT